MNALVAGIDYGHPLANGLLAFIVPTQGDIETANGYGIATTGSVPLVDRIEQPGYLFSASISNYLTVPSISLVPQPFSVYTRWYLASGGPSVVSFGGSGGGGKGWTLKVGGTSITLVFGGVAVYTLGTIPTGKWTQVSCAVSAAVIQTVIDQQAQADVACGTVGSPASTALIIGAAHNGSAYVQPWDGYIGEVVIWSRALTHAEMVSFQLDPYQVLRKPGASNGASFGRRDPAFDANTFAGVVR